MVGTAEQSFSVRGSWEGREQPERKAEGPDIDPKAMLHDLPSHTQKCGPPIPRVVAKQIKLHLNCHTFQNPISEYMRLLEAIVDLSHNSPCQSNDGAYAAPT